MNDIKVSIMDPLTTAPYYDRYLYTAIRAKNYSTQLVAITFHREPHFFTSHSIQNNQGLIDIVSKLKIRTDRLRQVLKVLEYFINLIILSVRFTSNPPHILHVQWLPLLHILPLELWFIKWCKNRSIKIVYTVHNILPHDTGDRHKAKFSNVYDVADALICHTEKTKNDLKNLFKISSDKIWIIPHGPMFYDVVIPKPDRMYTKLSCTHENIIVLFSGLIRPYKGVSFLLDAWREVASSCPGAVLILAGNGEPELLRSISEQIKLLGIEDSVRTDFRFIPTEEMVAYHQIADILVYPYKDITQSGALLTGMSFGKAIVATNVGGFKETLTHGKSAILVEYADLDSLSEALKRLIEEPSTRHELGKGALNEIESKYSWELIADRTLECYHSLLSNDKR